MSDGRNRGFTLVELTVVVTIIGLVAAVIAGAFVVVIRINPANQARADNARSLLGLTNHLPQDVSSAAVNPDRGIDYIVVPATFASYDEPLGPPPAITLPPGCDLGGAGTVSLAGLYWYEGSAHHAVNYRLVNDGGWVIKRFYCDPGFSQTLKVSSPLLDAGEDPTAGMPPVIVTKRQFWTSSEVPAPPAYNDGLEFLITTLDGETMRIHAASDNPAEATIDPITTVPPPPVTSPVNNSPVANMSQVALLYAGQTKLFAFEVTDPDSDPIIVFDVAQDPVASWPPDWSYLVTGQTVTVSVPAAAAIGTSYSLSYKATDDRSDPVGGRVTFTIADPAAGATTTTVFTPPPPPVPPPCVVSSMTIASSPTKRVDNKSTSNLVADVTITVSRSGQCFDLVLVYDPEGDGAPVEASFNDGNVVLIGKNTHIWSKGQHPLCVRDGFGNPDLLCKNLNIT